MARIFISYRRADSRLVAGRIYDRLVQAFGKADIFKDIDNIPPGKDFRGVLREATAACEIMLVIIGPEWLESRDSAGRRRLDNPNDFVRLEVQTGLERDNTLVIPVLVENATMPAPEHLPDALKELAYNNAFRVSDDPHFHKDMDSLITSMREHLTGRKRRPIDWRWIVGAVMVPLIAAVITILPGLINNDEETPTPSPTNAVAQITAQTPDATLTLDAMVANIIATNAAEETLTATAFTATPTATVTPDLTLTADAQATEAAVIAAVLLATQRAQLTANAPTNTAEPTATFTLTPSFTSPPTIMPSVTPDLASTAVAATQAHLAALATLDVQATLAAVQTPFPTPGMRQEIVREVRIISNRNANLRSGPGENFSVISTAAPNSTYILLEQRDGWYRISADAWVSSQVARIEQTNVTMVVVDWTPVERDFDGITMVQVPPGCFDMGSTFSDREQPIHEQCFDTPFWIGQTEVTNAQYAAFVAAGGYEQQRYWTDAGWDWKTENNVTAPEDYDNFTHANQPRIGVSWYEAVAYTRWLTEHLRANGAIGQDEEIRLPTEAEWEYAARGPANLTYPWGNDLDEMRLNAAGSADGYENVTAPVGSYPQNASWVGALDMSGNVWEWTLSEYGDYPYVSADGRNDVSGDAQRVLRGGSWRGSHSSARAASRLSYGPFNRLSSYGFRLCVAGG